jgi:catechol 2,3-dioxygenase-like lactoylglutathione lyase family enzyme
MALTMPLSHLEHFLTIADGIEATTHWYADVVGFRTGDYPDFGVPVNWLYLASGDVIHVAQAPDDGRDRTAKPGNGDISQGVRPIHHIACRASGLAQMRGHLAAKGVEFIEPQAGGQELYQLFMREPNGIAVEPDFPTSEAVDLEAPKRALNLADGNGGATDERCWGWG